MVAPLRHVTGIFPSSKFGYVTTLSDVPYQFSTENTLEHSKHRSEAIGGKKNFWSKSRMPTIEKRVSLNGGALTPCNWNFSKFEVWICDDAERRPISVFNGEHVGTLQTPIRGDRRKKKFLVQVSHATHRETRFAQWWRRYTM